MIQYRKKKSNKPFFLTVILLALLIFFSHQNPEATEFSSNALNTIITPINNIFYTISSSIQDTYDRLFGSKATQSQVEGLTLENQALEDENRKMQAVINQEDFLKKEYELMRQSDAKSVSANVTALDPSNSFTRLTINVGSDDGVKVNDLVVQGVEDQEGRVVKGLVGRVVEVGPNYAKVSTILDQANNLSVAFQNADYGVINSRDEEAFFGYALDTMADINIDDEVYTSGLGGIYPRGYYVGKVVDVSLSEDELTKRFRVDSPIDFTKLYRVLVIENTSYEEVENE